MKDLRERCENLLTKYRLQSEHALKEKLESFAQEIRNEALEEARRAWVSEMDTMKTNACCRQIITRVTNALAKEME